MSIHQALFFAAPFGILAIPFVALLVTEWLNKDSIDVREHLMSVRRERRYQKRIAKCNHNWRNVA